VVAITNDETGISEDPDVRFAVAEKIVGAAADHGIPACDIVVDPLVMPIGALGGAGRQVFALLRRLERELGVNTTCGASNISFGLPKRDSINGAFLAMAIANGLTSAITSPLHEEVRDAVMAADVLMGHDRHAAAWIGLHREGGHGGDPDGGGGMRRRGGRAARRGTNASSPASGDDMPGPEGTPVA
jgi:5-methyltetrahydrofolate--homocysteine methyltransferase